MAALASPAVPTTAPLTRALALEAAARFARDAGAALPVVVGSGRALVLDAAVGEWHVVFEEAADPRLTLAVGPLRPRYRRVAVDAATGACRWVANA